MHRKIFLSVISMNNVCEKMLCDVIWVVESSAYPGYYSHLCVPNIGNPISDTYNLFLNIKLICIIVYYLVMHFSINSILIESVLLIDR